MSPLVTTVAIAVGLLAAVIWIAFEVGFEKVFRKLFGWGDPSEDRDIPLEAAAESEGSVVVVTIRNPGPRRVQLAAIEGRDEAGKRVFPVPRLDGQEPVTEKEARRAFSRVHVEPGESATVRLDGAELRQLGCRSLAVLVSTGSSWPVMGYE